MPPQPPGCCCFFAGLAPGPPDRRPQQAVELWGVRGGGARRAVRLVVTSAFGLCDRVPCFWLRHLRNKWVFFVVVSTQTSENSSERSSFTRMRLVLLLCLARSALATHSSPPPPSCGSSSSQAPLCTTCDSCLNSPGLGCWCWSTSTCTADGTSHGSCPDEQYTCGTDCTWGAPPRPPQWGMPPSFPDDPWWWLSPPSPPPPFPPGAAPLPLCPCAAAVRGVILSEANYSDNKGTIDDPLFLSGCLVDPMWLDDIDASFT